MDNRKRGCFINCICMSEAGIQTSGVMKKVYSQLKVLRSQFDVDHVLINSFGRQQTIAEKVKRRLPFFPVDHHWKYSEQFAGYDFIYFRKSDIDYTVYKFFVDVKKHNPKSKIILEIPTYPYEKENFHGKKDWPMLIKDRVNHKKFHRCVDRIVTFSDDEKIWGIETIRTVNGVDFSSIQMPERATLADEIHMIEVSSPAYWHGYDRILEGMGQYYAQHPHKKVIFHIVGDGSEVANYRKIVSAYHIEDYVIFHGNLSGQKLTEVYRQCYVGIDSIGRHRSGNVTNSSLKSREYAANGIPFVTSLPLDFAPDNWEYALQIPADDSPVDITEVITFVENIYQDGDCATIAKKIREYAESKTDMRFTMRPILDYIQDGEMK